MNEKYLETNRIKKLYWDRNFTVQEVAQDTGVSFWALYNFMKKNNILRRLPSEANYCANKDKPQCQTKINLSIAEENLKTAGIMLYWAEGTLKGNTVDFTNSNPEMIKVFMRFLRNVCGVHEERLRVYLYAYSCHNIEDLMNYWQGITRIPRVQFTKPYIRTGNLNLSKRKLPHGLVHIRYNDKRLLSTLKNWIEEFVIRAGTQVAKGGRLCKRSVLPKGRMEK